LSFYRVGAPTGRLFPLHGGAFEELLRWFDRDAVERAVRRG
jgi:hypothetical protein